MSSVRNIGIVLSLAGMLLSSGCKKAANPVGPSGSGGQTGTEVSPTARQAAMSSVHQLYETVDWTNPSTAKQSLLQLLRSRPEFEASDTNSDPSLWARFTDGRLLMIAKNRESDTSSPVPGRFLHLSDRLAFAGGELPVGKTAIVCNAMGSAYRNPTPLISSMLQAKGYSVTTPSPTIDVLEGVTNASVFYLGSHGSTGTVRTGIPIYSVWTATPMDTSADAQYKPLWDNGELAYFIADVNQTGGIKGPVTSETRFAITKKFVINHMSFAGNSLIYIDACGSLDADFQGVCTAASQGATAAYAGWSYDALDKQATRAAYFVFDRLLGTNMDPFYKENPPQRPFTYREVLAELSKNNLDFYIWSDGKPTRFQIVPAGAQFGLLAPSIEHMIVEEQNQRLRIIGEFGSDQAGAAITINDQPMPITHWSIGELWCTLPTTGSNTSGDVKVIAHGDTSNAVRLTEWKGEVQVMATFPGSIGYTVTYSFHVRGDVHAFRTDPGGPAKPDILEGADGMPDCFAVASAAGSTTDVTIPAPGCTQVMHESWPASHDSASISMKGITSMGVAGELRPADKILRLFLEMRSSKLLTDVFADTFYCPNTPPGGSLTTTPVPFGEEDTLDIPFDNAFNLLAATSPARKSAMLQIYDLDPNFTYGTVTESFAGAAAINPPDPKAGQRPVGRRNSGPRPVAVNSK